MTLDIRGSLKNTKISSNRYVVLEELISNSIDSFLIRQHQDPVKRSLDVKVLVNIVSSGLLGDAADLSISCTDNGCGLGDEQTDAFLTKDTSYKDDLSIAGIGKCKGAGRIQFFHHFERVGIRSTYRSGGKVLTRTLPLVAARKKIDLEDFAVTEGWEQDIGTTITLEGLKLGLRERLYRSEALGEVFSAGNMRRHLLIAFLQRLVSLKSELGDFCISFETRYPEEPVEWNSLGAADLPPVTKVRMAQVEERDPRVGEPHTAGFRHKIHELSWKYTSSLKTFDMANLSQLVVRRAAIVEILALACQRELAVQAVKAGDRRRDERIIHSIIFPMKKDTRETSDHDIWLLSEEYQYYDYIASDKPLAQIEWTEGVKLFDGDIDVEVAETLRRRADENGAMRPDIAIFGKEGSAIIVEFKAPGVSMDDHVGDLSEYAHLLAAKSNGRLRKFYGYLIGDTVNPLRMAGWTRFASGKSYFRSTPLEDPESNRILGELYAETLFFDDVVDRASKRIEVYRAKLQIDLSKK